MLNNKFWQDRAVLVTGGGGFIGSHLVKALVKLKAKVIVLDIAPKLINPILSTSEIRLVKYFQADISQRQAVQRVFSDQPISSVFHLAAKPLVETGDIHPEDVFEANVMGTVHILEAVRRQTNCSLVLASTAHVYGENQVPLLEEYFPRPSRPYETSKACADMIAQTYAIHYCLPVAIARFVNIYGPGDTNLRLVPNTIQLLMKHQPPVIYDEDVRRDFLYITDAIGAYLTLGQAVGQKSNHGANIIYNFGSGHHYSTGQVIDLISQLMGKSDIKPQVCRPERTTDIKDQYLSVKKAKQFLGWRAQISLKQGLKITIDSYQGK
ncbi:MAG: NAD(P)-dependent oxidoreductase [Patescibacteria group bacterium]